MSSIQTSSILASGNIMKYIITILLTLVFIPNIGISESIFFKGRHVNLNSEHVGISLGKSVFLYKRKNTLIYSGGDSSVVLAEKITSNKYWLKTSGRFIYAFWWEKFAPLEIGSKNDTVGKVIYVRASQDGGKTFSKRQQVTHGGGVLPDFKIAADQQGHIAIAYLDERYAGHQIFVNSSQDGGKSWLEQDQRLNNPEIKDSDINKNSRFSASSPFISFLGEELIVAWEQSDRGKDKNIFKVISRSSFDFGKSWGKEALVYKKTDVLGIRMAMHADSANAYIVIFSSGVGVKLFIKSKGGKWSNIAGVAPHSDKAGHISYFRFASDEKNLYLTYVYGSYNSGRRWHTELVRLDKNKKSWYQDNYQLDLVMQGDSRGAYQDIAVLNDGTVVVVWEDFRSILPAIYLNYSKDNGDTWLPEPLPLVKKLGKSSARFPFIVAKGEKGADIYFSFNEYPEGKRPKISTTKLYISSFTPLMLKKQGIVSVRLPTNEEMEKRLKFRVESLMKARINKKWDDAWSIVDPLYRNRYSKYSWIATRDRLVYKKYKLVSVDVSSLYATSKLDVEYDLSADFTNAEENDPRFTNQKRRVSFNWGWFGDDWYLISQNPMHPYMP
jgi:hypothetical protein